jgi:hypothetical protein
MRSVRLSLRSNRIAALNTSALTFASLRPNKALELMRPLRGRQFSAAIMANNYRKNTNNHEKIDLFFTNLFFVLLFD